jgi:hypothetical protein
VPVPVIDTPALHVAAKPPEIVVAVCDVTCHWKLVQFWICGGRSFGEAWDDQVPTYETADPDPPEGVSVGDGAMVELLRSNPHPLRPAARIRATTGDLIDFMSRTFRSYRGGE